MNDQGWAAHALPESCPAGGTSMVSAKMCALAEKLEVEKAQVLDLAADAPSEIHEFKPAEVEVPNCSWAQVHSQLADLAAVVESLAKRGELVVESPTADESAPLPAASTCASGSMRSIETPRQKVPCPDERKKEDVQWATSIEFQRFSLSGQWAGLAVEGNSYAMTLPM